MTANRHTIVTNNRMDNNKQSTNQDPKTTDEKIAELAAELTHVKDRLKMCEQQLTKHQKAIDVDIPKKINEHPCFLDSGPL